MKHKKNLFYFLHFIIFSYNSFLSSPKESIEYLYSPNYSILNISNIFLHDYSSSSSISISTKELLFSNETNLLTNYSYFIATSKSGNISFISQNKKMFTVDFEKKMFETYIDQTNIINEDKVVLAFEGKLFIVKNNQEVQNFEEFTTPISELVDMTPFSLWFMPDYYFLSNKKYSIIKINKKDNKFNFDIELNLIVFVDYTLICLKDKEQVWNTTITHVYFLNKNEENKIKRKKIKIDELMLIYENNEKLENNIKAIFGNNLMDILFIHGYDKINKKYVKIYDFNTFNHIVHNNTINNIEEQSNKNILNGIKYKSNISEQYDYIDLLIYYSIIVFLIFWSIIFIFQNFIFKMYFLIAKIHKYFFANTENKIDQNNNNHISNNELNNNNYIDISLRKKESFQEVFQNIQNSFIEDNDVEYEVEPKERKKTIDLEASIKNLELNEIKEANDINKNDANKEYEENKLNNENKEKEKENQNDLKLKRKDLNNIMSKQSKSNKNIYRMKKIKNSLNMYSFSNSNTELKEISPKRKNGNENDLQTTEKKIYYKKDELNIKKEPSTPSTSLTRLEKDFKDISLVKKDNTGNNRIIILKGKHIIDEEIYAIKIKKLTNPNDEQSVINEAKNMTKIHSKHIVEYITCWFDNSLGRFEYLMEDDDVDEEYSESQNDLNLNDKNFSSTKNNKKIYQEDKENIFRNQNSHEQKKDDHYIKQLYEKKNCSDNETFANKKQLTNLQNKFYPKKNNNDEKKNKGKRKSNANCVDDSLLKSKISQNNISELNMYFFIQMEYCQGMTLKEYIKNHSETGINNKIMYSFTYQIIKSLARIHENKIVHRDINPENIFIDSDNSIKIGDFSSAKEIQTSKNKRKYNLNTNMIQSLSTGNIAEEVKKYKEEKEIDSDKENNGSTLYWSPEQELGKKVNNKNDIYAVGLVLYVMCECYDSEKALKKGLTELKKKNIFSEKIKKEYNLQYNLILKMIKKEPVDRPDCEKLLESDEMIKWKEMVEENN